jgi:uncharacterized protein (DUF885 family)
MRRAPLSLLFAALVIAFPPAIDAQAPDAFARLLSDVAAYRGRGFTLPLPTGVATRYSRRLEDVSEKRYADEAAALSGFAERLAAIDRTTLPAEAQLDAEILSRQLRDRRQELRFRAFEIPIGSREGFHFELPALPDRYSFDTIVQYDEYIAKLQSFAEHASQRIAMLRAGLKSGRTVPRDVLAGYDEPVAAQIVADVTQSPLYAPFTQVPATVASAERDRIVADGAAALRDSVMPGLRTFLEFLRREYLPGARATLGLLSLPDGEAVYQHRIRMHTTLELSPEQVHDTGRR